MEIKINKNKLNCKPAVVVKRFKASSLNSRKSSLEDLGLNPALGRLYGNYYTHTKVCDMYTFGDS